MQIIKFCRGSIFGATHPPLVAHRGKLAVVAVSAQRIDDHTVGDLPNRGGAPAAILKSAHPCIPPFAHNFAKSKFCEVEGIGCGEKRQYS